MNYDLTVVTPIKISNEVTYRWCGESMNTFYESLGPARPKHMISALIHPSYKDRFNLLIGSMGSNVEMVADGATALDGYLKMIEKVETKYVFLLLGDVKSMSGKDFMLPCMQAMDADPKLVQVRICGHPFSSAATNTGSLYSDGKDVSFNGDHSIKFTPLGVGDDVVWTVPMSPEKQKFFYAVPLWSTVMRTSYVKEMIQAVKSQLAGKKTLTDLSDKINGAPDLLYYDLPTKGWQEHLSFMSNYKQGSLNMACYMYAFDREDKNQEQFRIHQMNELKTVPPEGKL